MGGALPQAARLLALATLVGSSLAVIAQLRRGRGFDLWPPYVPLYGLVGLGLVQTIPLPPLVHAGLAPASYAIWHPSNAAAALVLGEAWRPLSVFPGATRDATLWLLGLLTLAALATPPLRSSRVALGAVQVVVGGAFAVAVFGMVAKVWFGPLLFGRISVPTISPLGPFVSKNHFAGYVGIAAVLAFGLSTGLARRANRGSRPLSWITGGKAATIMVALGLALALALAVLASQSRGGVLGLVAGLVTLAGLEAGRSRRTFPLLTATALAAGLLAWAALPREATNRVASVAEAPDDSGRFRLGLWRDSLRRFGQSPWMGMGLGAYPDAIQGAKTVAPRLRVEHAENEYLEILVEGGVAAAALITAALVFAFRHRPPAGALHGFQASLVKAAVSGLAFLAVHSAFDFGLRLPATAILTACLVAVAGGQLWSEVSSHRLSPRMGLFLALSCAGAALATVRPFFVAEGRDVIAPASWGRVRRQAEESALRTQVQARPADASAWALLGWLRYTEGGQEEGRDLVAHARDLDPLRPDLQDYARAMGLPAKGPPP